jgi:hypothetical protein
LYNFAVKNPTKPLTGFVLGPFGVTTKWDTFETLVLIGASTGASFTIPILEHVAYANHQSCVRRLEVLLVARTTEETEYYVERAKAAARVALEKGIDVRLHIAITGNFSGAAGSGAPLVRFGRETPSDSTDLEREKAADASPAKAVDEGLRSTKSNSYSTTSHDSVSTIELVRDYTTRPDIETLIREPVEQAWGETAVVVCGGKEIVARTRNCVARLSDERAVHKGTGAQGIYLHVEEYAF